MVNALDSDGADLPDPDSLHLARESAARDQTEVLLTAARFRRGRALQHVAQADRLARSLPLPQVRLPFVFDASLSADDVVRLAAALTVGDPS